jgi:hypothetical protein
MELERKSDYFSSLPAVARRQYEQKVTSCGLKMDPYVIAADDWTREPEDVYTCFAMY